MAARIKSLKVRDLAEGGPASTVWVETRRCRGDAGFASPFGQAGNPSYCRSVRKTMRKGNIEAIRPECKIG